MHSHVVAEGQRPPARSPRHFRDQVSAVGEQSPLGRAGEQAPRFVAATPAGRFAPR